MSGTGTDTSDIFIQRDEIENFHDMSVDYNIKLVNTLFPTDVNDEIMSATKEISLNDDSNRLQELYKQMKSPWLTRAFSPITPGSLRGSTFTLISSALGAGILSLPYMMKLTGLGLGSLFLILAASTALWSMYLLSKCSFRTSCTRYSDAVLQLLGEKWNVVFQIILISYVFGALVSYFITLNKFVAGLAPKFGLISEELGAAWIDPNSDKYYYTYITIAIIGVLCFPLASVKNLSGLRHLTIFSVVAIMYILFTIVWQAPFFYAALPATSEIAIFRVGLDALSGWGICAFSFSCHVNVLPVIAELQHPMEKRTNKIFNRCISVETIMYLCIAIGGYLSTLENTPDLFTSRIVPAGVSVGANDIFMTIGKLAMSLNLFFVLPINLNPCRLQIIVLLGLDKNKSNLLHYIITAGIVASSCIVAMIVPDITVIFGILGGFFATMLTYTFPAMIYLKCTHMRQGHYKRWLVYLIAALTTVGGFSSAFIVIFRKAGLID